FGSPDKAAVHFKEALTINEKLAAEQPASFDVRCSLAGSLADLSLVFFLLNKPQEAEKNLDRGAKLLRPADGPAPVTGREYPAVPGFKVRARANWLLLWIHLLRQGKDEGAVSAAQAMAQVKDLTGNDLYNLACIDALASALPGKEPTSREQLAKEALVLLR